MAEPANSRFLVWSLRFAGIVPLLIGGAWLVAWISGWAPELATKGVITVKTNMSVCLLLAGAGLLLLTEGKISKHRCLIGSIIGFIVLLTGAVTLTEHLFGLNPGIDQLLAHEPQGALATASPNRIGPPGSISLTLLGLGLIALAANRRWTPYFGVAVAAVNLVPLVGYLYNVAAFYSHPRMTGIAWPTVIALLCLGSGLVLAQKENGPMILLLRQDPGGLFLRQTIVPLIVVPLALGLLSVQGQNSGWFSAAVATGLLVISLIVIFALLLWRSARNVSQAAAARAQSDEALRQNEARLRAVLRSLTEGVVFLNTNGVVEEINESVRGVHGHTIEELTDPDRDPRWAMVRSDGTPFPEEEQPAIKALRTGEPVRDVEMGFQKPDGTVRWRLVNAQPARNDQGDLIGVVASFFDITERKQFLSQLERLVADRTAKLQELVSELEHFSYSITHDMRAPLRSMRGYADLALEILQSQPPGRAQEYLRRISVSAERMDTLITDALNYSQAVRQELPLEPTDLSALLHGMLESYPGFQSPNASIQIQGEIPAVLGNRAGLTQCFSNLIGNAVKFVSPGKSPEIRIWWESRPAAELRDSLHPGQQCWLRVWVEDNGIGIPPSMLPRVFNMFSRGSHDYEGTGIGLALVRKVVDRMGGRVGVESQLGKGSRFWVELRPAPPKSQASQPAPGV